MAQIYSNVKFNNYDLSSRFNLMTVSVTQNRERQFGLKRSIQMQDGVGNNPIFIKNKDERLSFQLELCKVANGEPTSITERELEEIGRVLFQNKVGLLEASGMLYYGVFTSSTSWFNGAMQGYLTLTFEMVTPYCYSPIYTSDIRVDGSKIVELYNKSSVSDCIYVDMEIMQMGNNGDIIEVISKTNGNKMKFSNIDKGEIISVMGEEVKEVFSKTNADKNVFKDMEYNDFINIRYGRNLIEVKGKCKIRFKYQLPLIMK